MKENLGKILILFLAMFGLIPPMFSEGGTFAVKGVEEISKGVFAEVPSIYWDNSFFTLMYLLVSFVGIILPVILPTIGKFWTVVSSIFGAWFFASFLYEVFNFAIPDIVLNSSEDRTLYTKFLIASIVLISTSMIREKWQKLEK